MLAPSRAANRHCGWETAEQLLEVGLRTAALAPAPFAVAVHYLISSDVTRKRTVTKSANNDHMTRCRKKESPQEEARLSLHQENSTPRLGPCSHRKLQEERKLTLYKLGHSSVTNTILLCDQLSSLKLGWLAWNRADITELKNLEYPPGMPGVPYQLH